MKIYFNYGTLVHDKIVKPKIKTSHFFHYLPTTISCSDTPTDRHGIHRFQCPACCWPLKSPCIFSGILLYLILLPQPDSCQCKAFRYPYTDKQLLQGLLSIPHLWSPHPLIELILLFQTRNKLKG